MPRRIIKSVGLLFILAGLIALSSVLFHFYFLFPNSHQLFNIRHNYFMHLEFHTNTWNYEQGEKIQIYASSAPTQEAQLSCYSLIGTDTLFSGKIPVAFQEVSARVAVSGTHWNKSYEIPIPADAETGWYVLELERGSEKKYSSVFVTPKERAVKKKVAVLLSTNTWNAYNHWGGQSLYSRNHSSEISFQRPQLLADPFIQNTYPNQQLYYQAANIDRPLVQLLADADIAFDVYAIEELHRSSDKLAQYEVLLFSTHPEYWTHDMFAHLNVCLDSGASVINLGGNTAAWYSHLDLDSRQLHVEKVEENMWKYHDSTGFRPFALQETAYGFHSFGPYEVVADTSFVWQDTDLKQGKYFGEYSETYDYAYAYSGPWQLLLSLFNKGKKGAAAGMELDKVYAATPDNWVSLARGWNQEMRGAGKVLRIEDVEALSGEPLGADMGYYIHPGGGLVFETGSLAFCGAIPYDSTVRQVILNVVRKGM